MGHSNALQRIFGYQILQLPSWALFLLALFACNNLTVPAISAQGNQSEALTAKEFVQTLHRGLDAGWDEFPLQAAAYRGSGVIEKIKAVGFDHIRIRTDKEPRGADLLKIDKVPEGEGVYSGMDRYIRATLAAGMSPILAYQGLDSEKWADPKAMDKENISSSEQEKRRSMAIDKIASWWSETAQHYKGTSYRLAFNILVEGSGTFGNGAEGAENINCLHRQALQAIRQIDPHRIVMVSSNFLSRPSHLKNLDFGSLTTGKDPYLMVEWHFYAAGPTKLKSNQAKRWIDGSAADRQLLTDQIQVAVNWARQRDVPTWVGAWMPAPFNKYTTGKSYRYTVPEQVKFASFMARSLDEAGVPSAINAVKKFYNYEEQKWFADEIVDPNWQKQEDAPYTSIVPETVGKGQSGSLPVLHAILQPNQARLYAQADYEGSSMALAVGEYPNLQQLGGGKVGAVMVPIDMQLTLYAEPNFGGDSRVYRGARAELGDFADRAKSAKLAGN